MNLLIYPAATADVKPIVANPPRGYRSGMCGDAPPTPASHTAELSVVIPVFNEGPRLPATLARLHDWMGTRSGGEVVFVDDGSTDESATLIERFSEGIERERWAVTLLRHQPNRGKGYACRAGALAARGDEILLCDADLSCPLQELAKLEVWRRRGFDVVIGSRNLPASRLDPPQPVTRRWPAAVFRMLRRRMLLPKLLDTQCGFKLFSRAAARAVFERVAEPGWLFDCEALALAERLGFAIKEVGVHWQHRPGSRVQSLPVALSAVPTLLAIRRRVAGVRASPTDRR